ncbi:uncharacterized protein LOC128745814 [Sabethes cyaneus]|uniref:uncharacterized protein LOC128745814 n=1 Tax=Sabethes cyaneus TaxID=53552 RepID=UPI00237E8756|nr:uncharacterized protein LOC128745814 [Sabethes cyaneus]
MYRQILLHPDDTPYQRILWRFSSKEPVKTYELMTVTYGLAPSSFLATRTLQQLAADEGGAESVDEAIKLRTELIELLAKGGFPLRKWTSNRLSVLNGLSSEEIGTQSSIKFDADEAVKALGISWEPESDKLLLDFKIRQRNGTATKRSILSELSQIFDPLGLISPILIKGKMLMQKLWLLPCAWDEEVPVEIAAAWEELSSQMPKVANFRISRYALLPNGSVQLHTFSDASEAAYGACTITLPRLELCAANVAAKLYAKIIRALQIPIRKSYFWSDSTVTLQWLRSPPNTWKTFVANRVSEIQELTHGAFWNHVIGTQNLADLLSRGMNVDDFLESALWKYGPEWLSCPENKWPSTKLTDYPIQGKERRKVVTLVVRAKSVSKDINPIFTRFSSFERLLRTTAYILRFISNVKCKTRTQPQPTQPNLPGTYLTVERIALAEQTLLRLAQADVFQQEIKDLRENKLVAKHSPIRLLSPFLDPEEIIRVGGRLRLSDQPFLSKHPALLPSNHPITRLIAKSHHLSLIHGGGRLTLAATREKYWPLHGRRLCRSIIRNCYRCARADPPATTQQIGQLPLHRITPSRPFAISGIDFAGPLYLKAVHKRAAATKAYVCIFVCFCTKAVHIELVSDLSKSTSAFLSALRRFISCRGRPSDVYTDNGKNFEGAANDLEEVYRMLQNDSKMQQIISDRDFGRISWHFNPPKAPHFGGL